MRSLFRRRPISHEYLLANGVVCLLGAGVWILLEPSLFQQFFYFGKLLSLTHLLTLGVVSSFMMGVLYRLSPVLFGVEVRLGPATTLQFVLFLIGSHGMIAHFWIGEWIGMSWSAAMLWAASLVQLWNYRGLYRGGRKKKNPWARRFVGASLIYFVLAASVGLTIALAKAYGVRLGLLADRYLANVFAHAHLAGLGWVGSMILGLQLVLVPSTGKSTSAIPWRFALWNGGVVVLAAAWLSNSERAGLWLVLGSSAITLAVVAHIAGPTRGLFEARTREWEILPLVSLLLVAVAGVLLAFGWPEEASPLRARIQLAYGWLALVGFMVPSIAATGFKLFPMWVWKERFQPEFGKTPVPGMKELHSETLRSAANVSLFVGSLTGAGAIVAGSGIVVRAATILVACGLLAFLWNLALVLRWVILTRPYRPLPEDETKFREIFQK